MYSSYQNPESSGDFAECAREESSLLGNDNIKKRSNDPGEEPKEAENEVDNKYFLSSKEINYAVLGFISIVIFSYFLLQRINPGELDRISEWVMDSGFLHAYILILASSIGYLILTVQKFSLF